MLGSPEIRRRLAADSHPLVGLGVLTKVCHSGAAVRFDANIHRHHHLVCARCGQMLDLADEHVNAVTLPNVQHLGFQIDDFSVHFRGTCSDCCRNAG